MPLYEYQCRDCRQVYEALIRHAGDEEGETCPACGSRRKERQFSVFGMAGVEKGGGGGGGGCGTCTSHNCGSCSCG